jgi:TPR repeat protein
MKPNASLLADEKTFRRKLKSIVFASTVLLGALGCQHDPMTYPALREQGMAYELTQRDREKLELRANANDADASFRLSEFYLYARREERIGLRWLRLSAEQGHIIAQNNLAIRLLATKDPYSKQEGIMWLERAAAAGDELARKRLSQIAHPEQR